MAYDRRLDPLLRPLVPMITAEECRVLGLVGEDRDQATVDAIRVRLGTQSGGPNVWHQPAPRRRKSKSIGA